MQICLSSPVSFSQIGQRTQQQDTLFPKVSEGSQATTLFIVCDGMGGADRGDMASRLLCDAVAGYVESMGVPVLDSVHLQAALDLAYETYLAFLTLNPLVNRMGSTLALVQFHERGATVAHVGDSRVYQLRAGKIIFQTKDHRQVSDMVEAGIITSVQAATHPWRNRLSRAVVVSARDSSNSTKRVAADCVCLTDIQKDDYFFLCTDGVQEQIDNDTLETTVNQQLPDAEKMALLLAVCREQTKDNYSAHLIGIRSVSTSEPSPSVHTSPSYAN